MADKEPSEMTDEELDKAIEQEEPASPPQEEPEETKEEPKEEPEPEVPAEESQEQPEEGEKPPSRREQLRVQDLLRKYGPPKKEPSQPNKPDFRNVVDAEEEVYKALEDTSTQYANSQANELLSQADTRMWRRFLATEDSQVRTKYPELDPRNQDNFHPALADALTLRYLRTVGYDPGNSEKGIPESVQYPDLSYSEFVDAEMEYINEAANLKTERTTQNIAKQAANTGIRPDGSSTKRLNLNKDPEDMTDEELDAVIARGIPKR